MLATDDVATSSNALLASGACGPAIVFPPRLVSRLRWRLLPLLWLGYCVCFIDRSNLAFAQLEMRSSLGLSDSTFGLASGLFFVSYATMQVPSNRLLDRLGARRVLAATLFAWSTLSACCGLVQGPLSLCALRFLLGLAEAGYAPGATLYQSRAFPAALVARSVAIVGTAGGGGYALGSLSAGLIMQRLDGALGLEGWRWLFVVQGVPGLLVGALVLAFLPDEPHQAEWLSGEERRLLREEREEREGQEAAGGWRCRDRAEMASGMHAEDSSESTGGRASRAAPGSLRRAVRCPSVWWLSAQHLVTNVLSYSCSFFMPEIVRAAYPSASLAAVSAVVSVPSAFILLLSPSYAAAADFSAASRFVGAWAALGLSGCALLAVGACMLADAYGGAAGPDSAAHSPVLLLCLLGSAYVAALCSQGPFWSLVSCTLQPQRLDSVGIALVNSLGNLGGFLGPYALGFMHDTLGPPCANGTAAVSQVIGAAGASGDDAGVLGDQAASRPMGREECTSQFGWGVVVLSLGAMLLTACTTAGFIGAERNAFSTRRRRSADAT